MRRDADVVVVGAGIAGLATARAAARAGRGVLLIEQFAPDHTRGSSHGTSRIFRLNYPDERYVRMAQAALDGWRELEADSERTLIEQTGALDLGPTALDTARALAACGARFEELRGTDVTRRFGIACKPAELALFQPDGGLTRSDRAVSAFLEGALHAGAELVTGVRVESIAVEGASVRIGTTVGSVAARAVVVTAGAWAPRLLAPLGIGLGVVPTRETVTFVDLPQAASLPSVIDYERLPTPGSAGLRRVGQAAFALAAPGVGLKVGLHHAGTVTDPDDDPAPDDAIAAWALEWAHGRYPGAGDSLGSETCIYTNTADEGFVLERHGRVVVGSACSGHGFKFAPLVGRTLAALATEAAGARG
jgi:sarcosine oxidase